MNPNFRVLLGLGVSSIALCCVLFGISSFVIPEILTREHGSELRLAMERYFAVEQKAFSTSEIDQNELETVMTPSKAKGMSSFVFGDSANRLYNAFYNFTITHLRVLEYSPTKAKVEVVILSTTGYRVTIKTNEQESLPDSKTYLLYNLEKIDGVWKVSGTESGYLDWW